MYAWSTKNPSSEKNKGTKMNNATKTTAGPQTTNLLEDAQVVLTKSDRCDRCGAEAIYAVGKNGFRLDMCKHHYDANHSKFVSEQWSVIADNSEHLVSAN